MQQPAPEAICLTHHQPQSTATWASPCPKLTSTAHLLMQPRLSHCQPPRALHNKKSKHPDTGAWQCSPTFKGFHVLKVPLHRGIHCLSVPLDGVVICTAPVGAGLAGLLSSLYLVAGNVDGSMHMDEAVHQSTIILARDGVPAVDHTVAAADQPPAGDDGQIRGGCT